MWACATASVAPLVRRPLDDREHALDHLLEVRVAVVDLDPAGGIAGGQRAVAVAQLLLQPTAGQPLAGAGTVVGHQDLGHLAPPARHRRVDVDQERDVGPQPGGAGVHDRIDDGAGQLTPGPGQHLGRVEVAIGDDDVRVRERGLQDLVGQLDLAGHVHEQLGPRRQRQVAGVAAEVPNPLGDRRRERAPFAEVLDLETSSAERGRHAVRDGGLSAAVDAFEDDEHSRVAS